MSFDITRDHGPSNTKKETYIPNIVHGSVLLPRKDPLRPFNPNESSYIKANETTSRISTDGIRQSNDININISEDFKIMERSILHLIKEDIEGENDRKSVLSRERSTKFEFNTVEGKGARHTERIDIEEAKGRLPQDENNLQNDIQTKTSSGNFRPGTANFESLQELIDQ